MQAHAEIAKSYGIDSDDDDAIDDFFENKVPNLSKEEQLKIINKLQGEI